MLTEYEVVCWIWGIVWECTRVSLKKGKVCVDGNAELRCAWPRVLKTVTISSTSLYQTRLGLSLPPFAPSRRGPPTSREALTNVEETPASTYTTQGGFGLTFVPPFQARLKHRANEVNGRPPPSPGGPPSAGRRQDSSLVNPRWARRPVAYRTTVPSDVSWQNRGWDDVAPGPGRPCLAQAVRLADRPRAEPRCVSFRRDEQCLTDRVVG